MCIYLALLCMRRSRSWARRTQNSCVAFCLRRTTTAAEEMPTKERLFNSNASADHSLVRKLLPATELTLTFECTQADGPYSLYNWLNLTWL